MTPDGPSSRLARNLAAESEAYGFSLATWGSGAVVVHAVGVPGVVGASAFVGGAVAGFALLAAVAFEGLFVETERGDRSLAIVSTVHVLATTGTVLVVHAVVTVVDGRLPEPPALFAAGVAVTVSYNLLLTTEDLLGRVAAERE
ncbi:hypothetical protein [Halobaculum gomorrense]|uniref:Uncharacterized protein n=1 Tax=Halobaculum gomorrense TaxID=43928 RepID=A0A1M5KV11_9EURY|nr:hypothetical protein [Halobaculum gomorrense]SHG56003.1 hypothetical protein SAMN05443636_0635 [Halobaculum gomorrense]